MFRCMLCVVDVYLKYVEVVDGMLVRRKVVGRGE